MEVKFFYTNLHLRDRLHIELMTEEALTSYRWPTVSDAYR